MIEEQRAVYKFEKHEISFAFEQKNLIEDHAYN
jgi:hypothetical protein